jgi:hypothetical protein
MSTMDAEMVGCWMNPSNGLWGRPSGLSSVCRRNGGIGARSHAGGALHGNRRGDAFTSVRTVPSGSAARCWCQTPIVMPLGQPAPTTTAMRQCNGSCATARSRLSSGQSLQRSL